MKFCLCVNFLAGKNVLLFTCTTVTNSVMKIAAVAISFVIFALLMYLICLRYYMRSPPETSIAFVSVSELTPGLVRDSRVPCVIKETFPGLDGIVDSVFKRSYVFKRPRFGPRVTTSGMYTLVLTGEGTEYVDLQKVTDKDTVDPEVFRVKTTTVGRLIVVPPRWVAAPRPETGQVQILELFDPSSAVATFLGLAPCK